MYRIRGLFIVFVTGYFFSFNPAFAQGIKYSVGPNCQDNKVVCHNPGEDPICVILEPRIHAEYIDNANSERTNRYEPACTTDNDIQTPECIDTTTDSNDGAAVLECVELIKCTENENGKLIATCSDGKVPQCLGDDNNSPDCTQNEICKNSMPICNPKWQAFAGGPNFH